MDWHLDGAYFDEVTITVLNDPNARQTALVTGDVDAVTQLELKTQALLERDPNIEIDNVPSAAAITMPMFCDQAPFDDVECAQRAQAVDEPAGDHRQDRLRPATMGNDFHHSPAMPYWPDDIPQREYDPTRPNRCSRRRAPRAVGRTLSVADSVFSGAVDMCVLYSRTGQGVRHRHQGQARAERRLLFRRLAEEAVVCGAVGRAPDAGRDVFAGLQVRRRLEREPLAERAVQRASAPGQGRAGRQPARRDVPRDGDAGAQ